MSPNFPVNAHVSTPHSITDIYNANLNISVNNVFTYSTDGHITWKNVTLNTGAYELQAINNEIKQQIIANSDNESELTQNKPVIQTQNFAWRLSLTGGVEKARWIIIGFQTDQIDIQSQNPALFDNLITN